MEAASSLSEASTRNIPRGPAEKFPTKWGPLGEKDDARLRITLDNPVGYVINCNKLQFQCEKDNN